MDISNLAQLGVITPPPSAAAVESVRQTFVQGLPSQLERLYQACNGFLVPMGASVYDAESVVERNRTYEVEIYCPGYVLIGDDSGGRGFLLRCDSATLAVFSSDLGDLSPEGFDEEARSLEAWVSQLA